MRELEGKRTRFSKTFDLGEGRRRLEIGQLPMHFERDGALHDIDLTPEFDKHRKHYVIKRCPHSLRVADDRPAYFYNSPGGKAVEVELSGVSGKPLVEDGLLKWAEVGLDTDYIIQPLPAGCATLLVLHSPNAPRKWSWRVSGETDLIVPLSGRDGAGRRLELIETRDSESGTISVEWTGRAVAPWQLRQAKKILWTDEVTWPVVIDPTINETIAAGADDAVEIWTNNGASFAVLNNTYTGINAGRSGTLRAYGGLRFQTIAVPVAATINSATLTVRALVLGGTPNIDIFGNDTDDAATWADPGNRIKNITKTTAVVNKADWVGSTDNAVTVTDIVAEIVARAGWASNNDIAFGFFNAAPSGDHLLNFVALEHATLTEARLAIDYTAAGGIADAAVAAAGAGTATGAASATAATALNAAGSGTVTGAAASVAASVFNASGSGVLAAVGEVAPSDSAAADISGSGTVAAAAASIASAAGFAEGSGIVRGATPVAEAVTYPPVGGGGGFGPGYRPGKQRFRTRKDKSHPKVITVRIGDWPENPQIILGRQETAEREAFHRRLASRPDEVVVSHIDEDEQALLEILAFAA